MKRVLVFLLSIVFVFGLFGGCTPEEQTPGEYDGYTELLGDPKFQGGINIDATGFGTDVNGRTFADYMGTATDDTYWNYSQHNCNLSTRNGKETKEGDWYVYTDSQDDAAVSKVLKVNPTAGSVALNCDASKDYTEPRTSGNDPWVHMLLGQGFYEESFVSEMDELILDISWTLTKMENLTGDAYNPSLHAAQFQLFFVVEIYIIVPRSNSPFGCVSSVSRLSKKGIPNQRPLDSAGFALSTTNNS